MSRSSHTSLIASNVAAIDDGFDLLSSIEQSHYIQSCQPAFQSTIGAHFRHTLEHYRCFFTQLTAAELCYDSRQREQLLEQDIEHAKSACLEIRQCLLDTDFDQLPQQFKLADSQLGTPVTTTLQRELLFLQLHTMHHYAMIGAMVRLLGLSTSADFGVAVATRNYVKELDSRRVDARQMAGDS